MIDSTRRVLAVTVVLAAVFVTSALSLGGLDRPNVAWSLVLLALNTVPLLALGRNPLAVVLVLCVAHPLWLIAAPASVGGVAVGFAAGIAAFAGIGALLGSIMPTARAAQGLGLLLFFGTFFLVGGGPPPGVLPDALNDAAGLTPTGMLVDAIRTPWHDGGLDAPALIGLVAIAAAGFALAAGRLTRI
jgi:ABC-2 type transport system permease protein